MADSTAPPPNVVADQPIAADDEAAANAAVHNDPVLYDDDSGHGQSVSSSGSTSLASTILRYRHENGRTYHGYKDGAYVLPNDDTENERLDLQHHLLIMTIGDRMFSAPVGQDGSDLHRVLDVGCGTGIWAVDLADEHPETHVIGIDLSPIQPSFVPPNVRFYVDDAEAEWTYSEPFDLVHIRMMSLSIADWPRLFQQTFDNLRPGGWVELLDPEFPVFSDDGTMPADSSLMRWGTLMMEGAAILGSPLDSVTRCADQMRAAGFVNVTAVPCKWPTNPFWPRDQRMKDIGLWSLENVSTGLQALSLALFTRALNWKPEELEVFLADVRKDLRNPKIHAYWKLWNIYAQKPE